MKLLRHDNKPDSDNDDTPDAVDEQDGDGFDDLFEVNTGFSPTSTSATRMRFPASPPPP
jgi:hypothetical protein